MDFLRKIIKLLTIDGWGKLSVLISAIVVMALLDMFGVVSILPFLTVIANPEAVETNANLKWLYDKFNFSSKDAFFIALGVGAFIILLINNILRAFISLAVLRFTWIKRYVICKKLLTQYLYGPYAFFLNRNSSELTAYLASEVSRVVGGVLIPCMQVLTRSLLAIAILVLLFMVDPIVSMVVIVVIGGGYAMVYFFSRKKLLHTGEDLLEHSKRIFKVLNEAFGGIKDIKLKGKEAGFIDKFAFSTKRNIDCFCAQFLIGQFPKYAFEVLAFGGILLITVYIVVVRKDYQKIIPLVGLYAFAAYRLMPALQQIFHELTLIRFNKPALDTIYQDYITCKNDEHEQYMSRNERLSFADHIEFKQVIFQYPKAESPVIEKFDLIIKKNTTVGFVGGTGAGKTTVIDLLLGLLEPQQGGIFVDNVKIEVLNRRAWQKNIGYVPQHIYLADDTVARNIAFGCEDDEIDQAAVERAGRLANIHDFIINELPKGYQTEVGERGVRLSGGQRQRIGIARALYYDPPVLVFDEATSALDGITEEAILEAIHNFINRKTIIIIAHRLSTVKECKIIYMLDKGKIVDQGTYAELIRDNEQFRRMAKAHKTDDNFMQPVTNTTEANKYDQ